MSDAAEPNPAPTVLEHISTRWAMISDPAKFVLRYAPAIERYLLAVLRDKHAAEEVIQELFLRVVKQQFVPEQITRGRFRDYLKAVVRNAALTYLRKQQARPSPSEMVEDVASPDDDPASAADREYVAQWKLCLIDRVWDALDMHQRDNPASRCYSVLRISLDHPDLDSPAQAALLSEESGETIRAEAFRKAVSRARRLFARYLLREVAATLDRPDAAAIEDELSDLGLLAEVLPVLPPDWRERKDLLDL